MNYYDFPFKEIIPIWIKQGGEVWQLIEPVRASTLVLLIPSVMDSIQIK